MPNQDGTGPFGRGVCNDRGQARRGMTRFCELRGLGAGRGRGAGQGFGAGRGLGFGAVVLRDDDRQPVTAGNSAAVRCGLEREAAMLEARLALLRQRLAKTAESNLS